MRKYKQRPVYSFFFIYLLIIEFYLILALFRYFFPYKIVTGGQITYLKGNFFSVWSSKMYRKILSAFLGLSFITGV